MKKRTFVLLTGILFAIDQLIKLYIYNHHLEGNYQIVKDMFYLNPTFNRDYSWINSLFGLGISKGIHIAMVTFIVVMVITVYLFLRYLNINTRTINAAFAFIIAGGLCSWVDKVFWDGSLDYIYVVNHFTFDLKDVYVNVFIGLMILMFIFDHQGFRTSDGKTIPRDFKRFILRK